jgi:hypothetical protein
MVAMGAMLRLTRSSLYRDVRHVSDGFDMVNLTD